jgi:hypothetical protein
LARVGVQVHVPPAPALVRIGLATLSGARPWLTR